MRIILIVRNALYPLSRARIVACNEARIFLDQFWQQKLSLLRLALVSRHNREPLILLSIYIILQYIQNSHNHVFYKEC